LRRNNFNPNRRRNFDNKVEGLTVEVRNGDVNAALRRFKKKIAEDGILQEYKERQFYTKPSEKRKKAKAAGRARWLKKRAKQMQDQGW
jgi:small subunit ribosomal protein S21